MVPFAALYRHGTVNGECALLQIVLKISPQSYQIHSTENAQNNGHGHRKSTMLVYDIQSNPIIDAFDLQMFRSHSTLTHPPSAITLSK